MRNFLISLFLLLPLHAGEPDIKALKETLAAHADAFERIVLKGDGTAVNFEIELGKTTVKFDGEEYDGFRFRCPDETAGRDFVWYFNTPASWGNWYIIPVDVEPAQAFKDWMNADKFYQPFDKSGEKHRVRILQTLGGTYFKPGTEYLMWFRKIGNEGSNSLRGTAAFAKKDDAWNHDDVEKALSLRPAPAEDQVAGLNSRGGLILLDNRFFERGYAEGRIDSAFSSIRSTQQTRGGFFITMQTFVPPCTTTPSLAEIVKQHGQPDFIRTGDELDRVRKHTGSDPLDDDERKITRYHYDYFAFEVATGAKDPKVLRVGTFGCNFSDVRPSAGGSTFDSIGIENLTVFHRDGKEAGRAYYFLEGSKKPLFITVPPAAEYRSGNQILISEGAGKWKWETLTADGKIARRIPLENDRLHGPAEGFHSNGKPSFKATYKNGELDGEVIQFNEEGKETLRRKFRDGEAVEE
jgi:hypothetical protein